MGGQVKDAEPVFDWWRLWPGRYARELKSFASFNAPAKPVVEDDGQLTLEVEWPTTELGTIRLLVGFSPLHPFARPTVVAPDLALSRHQDPFGKSLCLLTQDSGQWLPNMTVAQVIHEQLPRILDAVAARDEGNWEKAAQLEEPAPDPLSNYFMHMAELYSVVLFQDKQQVPSGKIGVAKIALQNRAQGFQGVLQNLLPAKGKWAAPDFMPSGSVGSWANIPARWVRLERPTIGSPDEILADAEREIAQATVLQPALRAAIKDCDTALFCITVVVFKEETSYGKDGNSDGLLFLVSRRDQNTKYRTISLARSQRITSDIRARLPVSAKIQGKTALVVGVGAIGSFVAVEMARAGIGTLIMIDFDIVEPGNGIRWALGRSAWGLPKITALANFIKHNYPDVNIEGFGERLGGTKIEENWLRGNPLRFLREIISKADVVIDTSASTECQHALAFNSRDLGKPYVMGYATEGTVGGVVAKFVPESPSCLVCLQEHWTDNTLAHPPKDSQGSVVLIGCNAPTFTGGAFDLQEVSLEVVRTAIGVLAPDVYDPGDWEVAVLTLKLGQNRNLPSWVAEKIAPHPRCHGAQGS